MKVSEAMHAGVTWATPNTSLIDLARLMRDNEIGAIPIGHADRLVGMVTDRDIVVRGLAECSGPEATIDGCMSRDVKCAHEADDLKTVLDAMGGSQIRRLPVVDENERLVGVVSLGDLSTRVKEKYAGEALEEISR